MASQNYARRRQTRLITLAIITLTLGIGAGFILFPNRRIEKKLLIPPVEALNKIIVTTCYSNAGSEEIEVEVIKPMEQIRRGQIFVMGSLYYSRSKSDFWISASEGSSAPRSES